MIFKNNSELLIPNWPAPKNILSATVLRNKKCPIEAPEKPRLLQQVHGHHVIVWERQEYDSTLQADASVTTRDKLVCAIQTADCLPILLTDIDGSFVGAVHAGWRGLAQNIIQLCIEKISVNPTDILVWLGPAIGPHKFEVQKDVFDVFDVFDHKKAFVQIDSKHWLCDIYEIAKHQLENLGIDRSQIFGGQECTVSDPLRFESYRRDKDKAGRLLTLIWKK